MKNLAKKSLKNDKNLQKKQISNKKLKKPTLDLEKDERYQSVMSDPLFTEMRRTERKVVVDDRFKGMFTDQRFSAGRAKIDKRGRPVNLSKKTNLENLYEMSEEDSASTASSSESEDENKNKKIHLDLARGEGNLTSSSEDEESEDEEEEALASSAEEMVEDWNELDKSARRVEWASRRLAICNTDWDRIRADDLLMLLSSFKPQGGEVKSLTIYISDFGAEKLAEEEIKGPVLDRLAKKGKKVDLESDDVDEETKAAIRAYQLDRLKYYYAILECDTEQTATAIYEACDGVEYETSGVRMDLRFVPDEMKFDESRLKELVRTADLNAEKYRPKKFENQALGNCNAKLTWDEADPHRKQVISEAFNKEKDLDDYKNLIASGSEDEDEPTKNHDTLKILFETAGIDHSRTESGEDDMDLQIDWEPALDEMEVQPKRKAKDDEATPFQQYLEKRKIKKKEYKAKIQELKKARQQELNKAENEIKERHIERQKKVKVKNDQLASSLPVDVDDERFNALFTHSAFAIDKTNPHYKGGTLADLQVNEKIKRSKKTGAEKIDYLELEPQEDEDLVTKLKKKSERLQRKRKVSK